MPLEVEFSAALAQLGPFGARPKLAIGCSGGADSTALALLTQDWAATHGGTVLALIVDHGLRPESAAQAAQTAQLLARRGIATKILTLTGLPTGPKLQETARTARHAALATAARAAGCLFLLLGHHAADQSETVSMRAARGQSGLEGMAASSARQDIVLLRPLLGIAPADLRDFLRTKNTPWIEDPSNTNPKFERIRIRQAGTSATPADPAARQALERDAADFLARHAVLRPEGFAILATATAPPAALAALLRVIGGRLYAPDQQKTAALAAALRPATLGGVRIAPAGRLGPGWLLAREPAACAPPIPATAGALWDHRFRLQEAAPGFTFGALGPDAASFRKSSTLPSLILRAMPCLRRDGEILFPALCQFTPPAPACHAFLS